MTTEEIRNLYRPDKIKILLVGESPPASEKFFYVEGGAMTAFTRQAFKRAYHRSFPRQEFLSDFQSLGCFLDDLCHSPVNRLKGHEREQALQDNIDSLADRIRHAAPEVVIAVFKKIGEYVRQAVRESGVPSTVYVLYAPGNGHQNKYIEGLSEILSQHLPINT